MDQKRDERAHLEAKRQTKVIHKAMLRMEKHRDR